MAPKGFSTPGRVRATGVRQKCHPGGRRMAGDEGCLEWSAVSAMDRRNNDGIRQPLLLKWLINNPHQNDARKDLRGNGHTFCRSQDVPSVH